MQNLRLRERRFDTRCFGTRIESRRWSRTLVELGEMLEETDAE